VLVIVGFRVVDQSLAVALDMGKVGVFAVLELVFDCVYGDGQLDVLVVLGEIALHILLVGSVLGASWRRTLLGRVRKWTAIGRPLQAVSLISDAIRKGASFGLGMASG